MINTTKFQTCLKLNTTANPHIKQCIKYCELDEELRRYVWTGVGLSYCPTDMTLQYTYSFFWAVMVTTGIGRDIMPVTYLEHVFSIIMIIVGVVMYAVIIGSASSAVTNLDAGNAAKKEKVEGINRYLRQRMVPKDLQRRIKEYYE